MALNFGGEPRSRAGLAAVISASLRHLMGLRTLIELLADLTDHDFRWRIASSEMFLNMPRRLSRNAPGRVSRGASYEEGEHGDAR